MYDTALADMMALEKEMLKTLSYFINKLEPITDTDYRNVVQTLDRFRMLEELIKCEE